MYLVQQGQILFSLRCGRSFRFWFDDVGRVERLAESEVVPDCFVQDEEEEWAA